MYCIHCGSRIQDGFKFCAGCGRAVNEVRTGRSCASCGAVSPEDSRFCIACGTSFEASPAQQQAPSAPAGPAAASQAVTGPAPRSGGALKGAFLALILVAVLGGVGYGAWRFMGDGSGGGPVVASEDTANSDAIVEEPVDFGSYEVLDPDPEAAVVTQAFGETVLDQVLVSLVDGAGRAEADAVADALGGEVVGGIEYVGLYQIALSTGTEAELVAAVSTAEALTEVEAAFPNEPVDLDLVGVRCTPLDDPVYQNELGRPQRMTGVQAAWDLVAASGIELSKVHIGVLDTAVVRLNGEFDGGVDLQTKYEEDDTTMAAVDSSGAFTPKYTHGTAVSSIIAADPDDGGVTGIASPLGSKLTLSHSNHFFAGFKNRTEVEADANDPTVYQSEGRTWAITSLRYMMEQVEDGATIINCSWGAGYSNTRTGGPANAGMAAAYRRFFEKMSTSHPDVLFVCSAGNGGAEVDGSRRYPSGAPFGNVITVGNIENDGTRSATSNMATANYEVTLAAPGQHVVHGVSPDGVIGADNGGTSYATPQVTATAALLRAIDPKLTAAEIKDIISSTAREEVASDDGATSVQVPSEVGGRCLAVDMAVLSAINGVRVREGKDEMTLEQLRAYSEVVLEATVDTVADWDIVASVPGMAGDSVSLVLDARGATGVGGSSSQTVARGDSASWVVSIDDTADVHVKRSDSGACYHVVLAGDITGDWDLDITLWGMLVTQPAVITDAPGDGVYRMTITDPDDGEQTRLDVLWSGGSLTMIDDEGNRGTLSKTSKGFEMHQRQSGTFLGMPNEASILLRRP